MKSEYIGRVIIQFRLPGRFALLLDVTRNNVDMSRFTDGCALELHPPGRDCITTTGHLEPHWPPSRGNFFVFSVPPSTDIPQMTEVWLGRAAD